MNYLELVFTIRAAESFYQDLIIDALAGIGFDTFQETDTGFSAYIPQPDFNPEKLAEVLAGFPSAITISYQVNQIAQQNWNEVWESNFEPIIIGNICYVRATFHTPHPEYPYEIVIDPKMAFGTGHHQTTTLMMRYMLKTDFKDKTVLDMGCGTGILAILAEKLGARQITAIDYDPVCYESTLENSTLNSCANISALCGSKEAIPLQTSFDIILANINRNILLDQIEQYARVSKPGTLLFLSGFYEKPDLEIIKDHSERYGYILSDFQQLNNWVAAKFTKL
ncbi:50S ribosomal protein L11 methyltransferase [Pedobacter sp. BS3]|uniref:50S ribosomal protein L11 methyltransferase n=1 Tax=Pedobacter sp. BS3 TaxID=2567937 RepID=UPI0011EF3AD2|nr:50S ribosomal protein L11 methyltransferase [Pedobacter sp. BS3]TZF84973.1 50S ribosomal protein L11 methyltransferase [Pedobacter sp. BS3]